MVVGFFIFGYKFDKTECTEKEELRPVTGRLPSGSALILLDLFNLFKVIVDYCCSQVLAYASVVTAIVNKVRILESIQQSSLYITWLT